MLSRQRRYWEWERGRALRNMRCNAYQRRQPTWFLPLHFAHFFWFLPTSEHNCERGKKGLNLKRTSLRHCFLSSSLDLPIGFSPPFPSNPQLFILAIGSFQALLAQIITGGSSFLALSTPPLP
jgi:hypothetical protein